jgi:hypothetical protein
MAVQGFHGRKLGGIAPGPLRNSLPVPPAYGVMPR